jgi:hypothetical protein
MQENISLDRPMTREQEIALKNRRTGLNIFQISWIMVFICLVIVNWQLRFTSTTWPPPGVQPLEKALPTIATFSLLASAFLARRALMAINAPVYDLRLFLVQWRGVLLLGQGVRVARLHYHCGSQHLPPVSDVRSVLRGLTCISTSLSLSSTRRPTKPFSSTSSASPV